ncbi:MAG: dihydroneopterin aldolase [Pseudomonadota bacterium]
MDRVFLEDFAVTAVIGIWEWERQIEQRIEISLEMAFDTQAAAVSDDVADTLNYKAVADGVAALTREGQFKLVEALAGAIADYVLGNYAVPWIRVRVSKPGAIRGSRHVGVEIERGTRPD